ncbi:hypothetical protein CHS0354_000979 [Potamilus streckersoni]|uniref:Uncharacterized protein n=1 Tax=Potamilus streckersoni TaxID=2493646 RepID=A0AAE0SIL0_9BIVA|nr:hypothetical protein CHS0354_000979 [Potamilus streckersoni]
MILTNVDLNTHKVPGYTLNVIISDGYYNVGPKTLTIAITGTDPTSRDPNWHILERAYYEGDYSKHPTKTGNRDHYKITKHSDIEQPERGNKRKKVIKIHIQNPLALETDNMRSTETTTNRVEDTQSYTIIITNTTACIDTQHEINNDNSKITITANRNNTGIPE